MSRLLKTRSPPWRQFCSARAVDFNRLKPLGICFLGPSKSREASGTCWRIASCGPLNFAQVGVAAEAQSSDKAGAARQPRKPARQRVQFKSR